MTDVSGHQPTPEELERIEPVTDEEKRWFQLGLHTAGKLSNVVPDPWVLKFRLDTYGWWIAQAMIFRDWLNRKLWKVAVERSCTNREGELDDDT